MSARIYKVLNYTPIKIKPCIYIKGFIVSTKAINIDDHQRLTKVLDLVSFLSSPIQSSWAHPKFQQTFLSILYWQKRVCLHSLNLRKQRGPKIRALKFPRNRFLTATTFYKFDSYNLGGGGGVVKKNKKLVY